MSILIKNMEMPKRCEDCFCYRHNAEYDYAYCNISSVNVLGNGSARLNSCPLIPVPPHGRLIDGDVAEAIYFTDEDADGKDFYDGILYSADFISNQPTIIEAEGGE